MNLAFSQKYWEGYHPLSDFHSIIFQRGKPKNHHPVDFFHHPKAPKAGFGSLALRSRDLPDRVQHGLRCPWCCGYDLTGGHQVGYCSEGDSGGTSGRGAKKKWCNWESHLREMIYLYIYIYLKLMEIMIYLYIPDLCNKHLDLSLSGISESLSSNFTDSVRPPEMEIFATHISSPGWHREIRWRWFEPRTIMEEPGLNGFQEFQEFQVQFRVVPWLRDGWIFHVFVGWSGDWRL